MGSTDLFAWAKPKEEIKEEDQGGDESEEIDPIQKLLQTNTKVFSNK